MDRSEAKAILENILFVADAPVPLGRIASLFEGEFSQTEVSEILAELAEDYTGGSLRIAEVAEGWRMQTNPELAHWVTSFFKMEKGQRLSRASLEVLAIVAYRQPITRAEIDEIRGVDSGGVLRGLIDKGLVKTMGRRKAPGRPMMYGTTNKFLEFFGLARLADMPTLAEFEDELGEDVLARQESMEFAPENGGEGQEPVDENSEDNPDTEPGEEDDNEEDHGEQLEEEDIDGDIEEKSDGEEDDDIEEEDYGEDFDEEEGDLEDEEHGEDFGEEDDGGDTEEEEYAESAGPDGAGQDEDERSG